MKLINEQIQYVEFLTPNISNIKQFYSTAFAWVFTDFGPDYTAFTGEYIDGGFTTGEAKQGSVLVILYSTDLEVTREKVIKAGGEIIKDIFDFPGGRRFEFTDPDGNRLAVWSE